jgi:nonribosomal peptide synthetase protein BlmIV
MTAVHVGTPETFHPVGEEWALSYGQERIWLLSQLADADDALNLVMAVRLRGRLNLAALRQAFEDIAARHEVLRCVVVERAGNLRQRVSPHATVYMRLVDLVVLAAAAPATADSVAERLLHAEARRPFDLAAGPVLRVTVVARARDDHIVVVSMHHIATDAWSLGILAEQMSAVYGMYLTGRPGPFAGAPRPRYRDFAEWQRHRVDPRAVDRAAARLRSLTAATVPLDRSPGARRNRAEVWTTALPPSLTGALHDLRREHGGSLFMLALTAVLVVLRRLNGRTDLAVGTLAAGRTRPEWERVLGYFANVLVVRADLAPDGTAPMTFRSAWQRVREACLEAYEDQDLPYEMLVERLRPDRGPHYAPLVSVLCVMQPAAPDLDLPGLDVEPVLVPHRTAHFDLTVEMRERGSSLHLALQYDASVLDGDTVALLGRYVRRTLETVVSDVDIPCLALELDPPTPQHLETGPAGNVHGLFEEQAARTPDAVAIVHGDRALTYRALNGQANRLARHLRGLGVRVEDRVGIYLPRSLECAVAVLGVLKAGAAYVPLDPTHPAARTSYLLSDCGARFVLTAAALTAGLDTTAAPVLVDDPTLSRCPDTDPGYPVHPDNVAYVIYTSGSTGPPKGVLGPHRGIVNRLAWGWRAYPYTAADRVGLRTPLTFVDSVAELFAPLLQGVPVEVIDADIAPDPEGLTAALALARVTRIVVVPSLLRLLLDSVPRLGERIPLLRTWVTSGERLPVELAERFHASVSGGRLINLYGSTEIAADVTADLVAPGSAMVTAGTAIANVAVTVVEPEGGAAARLVAGELYVGGAATARGYHARPALTAARFLPDPTGRQPGGRVFRTGDLARARADGRLELLGRVDQQLKVRGIRVEPGEIEEALRHHPAVVDAVVVGRDDATGSTILVGYVVLRSPCPAEELRAHLRGLLPTHLVPATVIVLERLPRTSSGKVDRTRLPDPSTVEQTRPVPVGRAPRTPAERAVASVYAELLPVRWRDVEDDFFALGGHSILAASLVYRLRERCGVALGLQDIFATPTIAGLAQRVEQAQGSEIMGDAAVVPCPDEWYDPFPLTEVQQAYWIGRDPDLELGNTATHGYFEVDARDLDVARLTAAVRTMIDRHHALRTVVRPDGVQQVLRDIPAYDVAVADLRAVAGPERDRRLAEVRAEMSHQVLPAHRWPLFDITVSLLPAADPSSAPGTARIHVSIDALIADAYSVSLLMAELGECYHGLPGREPMAVTFRDCVTARESARTSLAHGRAMEYWRRRLPELPPGPELPLVRQPSTVDKPRFRRRSGELPAPTWAALREQAARVGVTAPVVLLAAFTEVITRWSRRDHYVLMLTLFNRDVGHPQANEIIGDFTSLNLLEVDHRQAESFGDRARRLQARLWTDLDHRLVSGVTVLREWTRMRGGRPGVIAPVVFTSNLGLDARARPELSLGERGFSVTQTPQVYLDHQVAETPDGLVLTWDAVEDLFPPGLLDDAFGTYLRLLTGLADGSRTWAEPVRGLLPQAQRDRRRQANATAVERPTDCLQALVASAVARNPDGLAVVDERARLNYRELADRSGRLAHRLRGLGVTRGELVGVAMRKGWEQVVAVTAVVASGAAYVPLDPDLPEDRLRLLCRQTGVRHILTQSSLAESVKARTGVEALAVDREARWGPPHPLGSAGDDRDNAYVIFTSGSTGVPKGVTIDHRGAVNTILDINNRFGLCPGDRVLGLSSLSFDLSVFDIFGTLAAGGTLVLPDPVRQRDPGHWLDLIRRWDVTVWNSVPALLGLALDQAQGEPRLGSLRLALLSGDWIPVDLPDRLRRVAPHIEVVSLGGATEVSIWSVFHPIGAHDPQWTSIPYGRPLSNQRAYVLDAEFRERPDWVAGELYLAGDGLATGYWGDPDRTAHGFPTHPRSGERLYRTGDIARYRPSGDLEFLGREDLQVKVNGLRVELGEVEAALGGLAGVAACAVCAIGPARGDKRLAAYVVPEPGSDVDPGHLREGLRRQLPAYLVPTTFTAVASLPLTANGKVDRSALSDGAAAPARSTVDASDELTRSLCEAWQDALAVDVVRPDDNFFSLGGTSLSGIRLVGRLQEAYGVKISLVRLYETPTVSELAAVIAQALTMTQAASAPQQLVPDAVHRYDAFPLTPIQEAYWLGRRDTQPLGGVAAHSYVELDVAHLDVDRLEQAIRALVTRHEALRTVILSDATQRVLPDVPPYQVARADLAEVDTIRSRMSHRVYDPGQWPLFDVVATNLDDTTTRLHISIDLIVADALSFRILQAELLALYQHGDAATLAPLGCSFRDYLLTVSRHRDTAEFGRARDYWRRRLPELPSAPPLPQLHDSASTVRPRFSRLEGRLDAPRWAMLRQRAAGRKLTPSGLLCAAYADVLALWSQTSRFTINMTTFNRLPLHPDVERLVGDFTSTTLLTVDATARTFAERAGRVQAQIFADLEHRQFGGVDVLRLLRADSRQRAAAWAPIVFTSMLVPEPDHPPTTPWKGSVAYAISQTPQVLLDHQVYEHEGTLVYTWDHVAEAFPAGLIDSMFSAYGRLLNSLLTDGAYWEAAPGWTA